MFCCCLWRKARLWAIYVFGKSAINSLAINTWKVEALGGEVGGRGEEGERETWKIKLNSRSGKLHNQSYLQRLFFSVSKSSMVSPSQWKLGMSATYIKCTAWESCKSLVLWSRTDEWESFLDIMHQAPDIHAFRRDFSLQAKQSTPPIVVQRSLCTM